MRAIIALPIVPIQKTGANYELNLEYTSQVFAAVASALQKVVDELKAESEALKERGM